MPEISRFRGIVIGMFYREHEPPHFHAACGDFEIIVEISTGAVAGRFPGRARALVLEWTLLHREELMRNWVLAREGRPLRPIAPLE